MLLRQIELSLVNKGFAEGGITPDPPEMRTGKRVAIVGSIPAGLACADYLNKLCHRAVAFEKDIMPDGIVYFIILSNYLGLARR
jgi:glutamate synthase (NADPH/NADH) small chain